MVNIIIMQLLAARWAVTAVVLAVGVLLWWFGRRRWSIAVLVLGAYFAAAVVFPVVGLPIAIGAYIARGTLPFPTIYRPGPADSELRKALDELGPGRDSP